MLGIECTAKLTSVICSCDELKSCRPTRLESQLLRPPVNDAIGNKRYTGRIGGEDMLNRWIVMQFSPTPVGVHIDEANDPLRGQPRRGGPIRCQTTVEPEAVVAGPR